MRILVAGDWHSGLHEEAAARALTKLGHTVERFAWHAYFARAGGSSFAGMAHVLCRAQNKYLWGPQITILNRDFVELARRVQPDAIFIYRGTHIRAETMRTLRTAVPSVVLVGYNNDDPFAPGHIVGLWRHFVAGLSELDLALAYRHTNVDDFRRAGARRVKLLRSWYIPELNRPVELAPEDRKRFACDVVFIGHYEPDMRLSCLEQIVNAGWNLRLFGHQHGWHRALQSSSRLRHLLPMRTVWGDAYNKALCAARVALCFFSKLNRDSYTRRCFEIPASGSLMLSEYSEDLATMFTPGVEADYFRSPRELCEKLGLYLGDESLRLRVASAGRARVLRDGHDVVSRMQRVIEWIEDLRTNR